MSTKKFPLSALPLPAPSRLLIHNLTPDTHTPSPHAFLTTVLRTTPSLQRRARLLSPPCHYTHVTPFPVPFPYDIDPPPPSDDPVKNADKSTYIEEWLTDREAIHAQPPLKGFPNASLRKYMSQGRDRPTELIGISETGLRDCLPHLDVGDAFAVIGAPSLTDEFGEEEAKGSASEIPEAVEAREELVDILSGRSTLMSPPEVAEGGFAPWSLRYSGHQFGSWAGQLGDGRAISILVTPNPKNPDETVEVQLKGSGRTPFSRSADGLAVVRSSIREYLCSEAMHALSIPTTRSLSLISLPTLPVRRDDPTPEPASILTRLAPSFLRIGNFEALNGVSDMFFFGGGQQKRDLEALRVLGVWVAKEVLRLPGVKENKEEEEGAKAWGTELVLEVTRRNAKMVAAWQAYGFMHGVMNTDNISILGLTIDYGPYAFMDVFEPNHICNHTDESGRYSYQFQPTMIIYALRALLTSLSPLIGAELESGGQAVKQGWAEGASEETIKAWAEKGVEAVKEEVERVVQQGASDEYGRLMRKRLGLSRQDPSDESRLFKTLLQIMQNQSLDFHSTFRSLCSFTPSWAQSITAPDSPESPGGLDAFVTTRLFKNTPDPERLDVLAAKKEWVAWLETYARRIQSEVSSETEGLNLERIEEERKAAMRNANPRFVLRQWVLEEVIKRVEGDSERGKRVLAKVMHMACNPFEPWGAEDTPLGDGDGDGYEELSQEEKEERRFCGLGEKKMLGFQCSCSS